MADFEQKILNIDELLAVVQAARREGKTIAQCHGCFDIVHPGHIRYLEFARRQGDILIVSVTGDLDVNKGLQRPYIPQQLRAENLAALMVVDYVHINPAPTAEALLDLIRPDVYVKGKEYESSKDPAFLAEKAVVERNGGRMIFSSGEIVFSSSEIIDSLPRHVDRREHRLKQICGEYEICLHGLTRTMHKFADLRVMVIGDTIVDRYILCDALGVASEAPVMTLAHRSERRFVGGAAIVARHVRALGAKSMLLTSAGTGKDENTQFAADILRQEGVELLTVGGRSELVEKARYLADETKVFRVDRAEQSPLDSVTERAAARIIAERAKGLDAVIFCDFGYGMVTASLLHRVLPMLRQNVPILTADISGGRAALLNFQNVDMLCPTEREARATLTDNESGLSTIAWNILQHTQARHIMITLEKRGLLVFERRSQRRDSPEWAERLRGEQLPSFADHAVDQLGCGDALLSAATLTLAAGGPLMHAAYLGNAAAAIEAGYLGNQPVESRRLQEFIQHRRELAGPPMAITPAEVTATAAAIQTAGSRA